MDQKTRKINELRAQYKDLLNAKSDLEELTHKLLHKSNDLDALRIESLKKHVSKKGRQLEKMKAKFNDDREYFVTYFKNSADMETVNKLMKIKL